MRLHKVQRQLCYGLSLITEGKTILDLLKTSSVIAALSLLSACSAKTETTPIAKSYLEMTELEQEIEIEKFVELFNKQHMADLGKSDPLKTKHYGDSQKDMIYAVGTYPKHVSAKDLKKAQKGIKLTEENANICAVPEMVYIAKLGIGYQLRMVDLSGKIIYESKPCQAAKKTASTSAKLRGGYGRDF